MIKWLINLFNNKEFPDPFKVCPWARQCVHVDGMYCTPGDCVTADAFEKDENELLYK